MLTVMIVASLFVMAPTQGPVLEGVTAGVTSTFTSVKRRDCRRLSYQDEGMHAEYACKGYGGYSLRIHDSEHGGEVHTYRGKHRVFEGSMEMWWDVHDGKVEWRYRYGKQPHAFIYRKRWNGPPGRLKGARDFLSVVRLQGTKACKIGTTRSNQEAKRIADDMSRPCL